MVYAKSAYTTRHGAMEGRMLVQGRSNPRTGEIESPYRGDARPLEGRIEGVRLRCLLVV